MHGKGELVTKKENPGWLLFTYVEGVPLAFCIFAHFSAFLHHGFKKHMPSNIVGRVALKSIQVEQTQFLSIFSQSMHFLNESRKEAVSYCKTGMSWIYVKTEKEKSNLIL